MCQSISDVVSKINFKRGTEKRMMQSCECYEIYLNIYIYKKNIVLFPNITHHTRQNEWTEHKEKYFHFFNMFISSSHNNFMESEISFSVIIITCILGTCKILMFFLLLLLLLLLILLFFILKQGWKIMLLHLMLLLFSYGYTYIERTQMTINCPFSIFIFVGYSYGYSNKHENEEE